MTHPSSQRLMAEIGKPVREITYEPLDDPVPAPPRPGPEPSPERPRRPGPERQPEPTPA